MFFLKIFILVLVPSVSFSQDSFRTTSVEYMKKLDSEFRTYMKSTHAEIRPTKNTEVLVPYAKCEVFEQEDNVTLYHCNTLSIAESLDGIRVKSSDDSQDVPTPQLAARLPQLNAPLLIPHQNSKLNQWERLGVLGMGNSGNEAFFKYSVSAGQTNTNQKWNHRYGAKMDLTARGENGFKIGVSVNYQAGEGALGENQSSGNGEFTIGKEFGYSTNNSTVFYHSVDFAIVRLGQDRRIGIDKDLQAFYHLPLRYDFNTLFKDGLGSPYCRVRVGVPVGVHQYERTIEDGTDPASGTACFTAGIDAEIQFLMGDFFSRTYGSYQKILSESGASGIGDSMWTVGQELGWQMTGNQALSLSIEQTTLNGFALGGYDNDEVTVFLNYVGGHPYRW